MDHEMKLAVLIDAENISNKYIDVILSEANNLGDVIYKRIYGNWTTPQMASWRSTILDNYLIERRRGTEKTRISQENVLIVSYHRAFLNPGRVRRRHDGTQ